MLVLDEFDDRAESEEEDDDADPRSGERDEFPLRRIFLDVRGEFGEIVARGLRRPGAVQELLQGIAFFLIVHLRRPFTTEREQQCEKAGIGTEETNRFLRCYGCIVTGEPADRKSASDQTGEYSCHPSEILLAAPRYRHRVRILRLKPPAFEVAHRLRRACSVERMIR